MKYHRITSRILTRLSLSRKPSGWYSKRLSGGGLTTGSCTGTAHLRLKLSVGTVAAFMEAFNQVLRDKEQYIARFEKMLTILADASGLNEQL